MADICYFKYNCHACHRSSVVMYCSHVSCAAISNYGMFRGFLPCNAMCELVTSHWPVSICLSRLCIVSNDVTSRWREDWQSATVVNSTLVVDPTIRLPGFDLHRRQWSLLNRLWTGQGHCNACHKKWGFTDNELCDCGEIQTMSHIVNSCSLTKFDGGLLRLHEADEAAVDWLTTR